MGSTQGRVPPPEVNLALMMMMMMMMMMIAIKHKDIKGLHLCSQMQESTPFLPIDLIHKLRSHLSFFRPSAN